MSYRLLDDAQLLSSLRLGDETAFAEIYRRYWRQLYLTARQKIYSGPVIEELLQDLFTKLWERRGTAVITHLEAYLFSSLKYAIINHIKLKMVQERYVTYALAHHSEEAYFTDEQIALDDLVQAINQCVAELPEKTRQVFELNRMQYKSAREIALLLQLPERTVEYHITKATKALRLHLRDFFILLLTVVLQQQT